MRLGRAAQVNTAWFTYKYLFLPQSFLAFYATSDREAKPDLQEITPNSITRQRLTTNLLTSHRTMHSTDPRSRRIEDLRWWLRNRNEEKRRPRAAPLRALRGEDAPRIHSLTKEEMRRSARELAGAEAYAYPDTASANPSLMDLMSLRRQPYLSSMCKQSNETRTLMAAGRGMDEMAVEAHNVQVLYEWRSVDPESMKWRS